MNREERRGIGAVPGHTALSPLQHTGIGAGHTLLGLSLIHTLKPPSTPHRYRHTGRPRLGPLANLVR